MCGICGIIGGDDDQARLGLVKKMNMRMVHRGPDAEGIHHGGIATLGHRRLSIIDLSEAANQPFTDPHGRYVMVFNGEIYNFMAIRDLLPGFDFRTKSDTETVLAAYIRWGADCLKHFEGMFALAIWDNLKQELFVARDRFGVKPLYYRQDAGTYSFASEIRPLLATLNEPPRIEPKALEDYLRFQSVITPLTLVRGTMQLPAGFYGTWKRGEFEMSTYWDPASPQQYDGGTVKNARKKVRELLFRAVEKRLVSDVPVGAFLSGGIDSSAIVSIMAEVGKRKPSTFTIGFREPAYDESKYAEFVAKRCGADHARVVLGADDFLDALPDALASMDSPSGDGLNTYVVSKAIRQSGITVALSGVGGDELFAGYPIFRQFSRIRSLSWAMGMTGPLRRAVAGLLPVEDQRMLRLQELMSLPDADITRVYPIQRQILHASLIRKLVGRPDAGKNGSLEDLLQAHGERMRALPVYSQVSVAEYLGYTQHVLLKDMDQMSMASSLEAREPFFDHLLVEYVLSLPDGFKKGHQPKTLLVDSLGSLLPREIVNRPKMGFVLPYDHWLRHELKDLCEQRLSALAGRSGFDGAFLSTFLDDFMQGRKGMRWADIWVLVVLADWLERNGIN